MPGIMSGFLMAATMSMDDFVITYFTRVPGINTISTMVYSEVKRGIQPEMYALSTLLFLLILFCCCLLTSYPEEKQYGGVKETHEYET